MIVQWVAIASATFSGIALVLNFCAFKKNQVNIRLNLLADFTSRYLDLVDKQEEYSEKGKSGQFAVLFLNLLEWFAFMANHKYLPDKMTEIYHGIIINWYEKMWEKQREALLTYLQDQPNKFSELDELYKKIKN